MISHLPYQCSSTNNAKHLSLFFCIYTIIKQTILKRTILEHCILEIHVFEVALLKFNISKLHVLKRIIDKLTSADPSCSPNFHGYILILTPINSAFIKYYIDIANGKQEAVFSS